MTSFADLVPHSWYISIVCACGERLLLFQDLTNGKGSLAGAFTITCPSCGERGCYPAQHYRYDPERAKGQDAQARAS